LSLELEVNLSRLEREIREIRRTQLLMIKTWIRLMFNDTIPFELVSLMAELDKRVERLEKDLAFPLEKALKEG